MTAEGQGLFFATKAEAIADVEHLRARGVRNIDVGCMQVNLFYHADAFDGLDDAFDPARNVAYKSVHLKRMCEDRRSWPEAAAYHSTTPEFADSYREKLMRIWRNERDAPPTRVAARPASNERATRLAAPPRTMLVPGPLGERRRPCADPSPQRPVQVKRAVVRTRDAAETRNASSTPGARRASAVSRPRT